MLDGSQRIDIAPVPVKAVDSNGAGDMFAGAFLYALCAGRDHASAGRLASHAAAATVSVFGPRLPPAEHQRILKMAWG